MRIESCVRTRCRYSGRSARAISLLTLLVALGCEPESPVGPTLDVDIALSLQGPGDPEWVPVVERIQTFNTALSALYEHDRMEFDPAKRVANALQPVVGAANRADVLGVHAALDDLESLLESMLDDGEVTAEAATDLVGLIAAVREGLEFFDAYFQDATKPDGDPGFWWLPPIVRAAPDVVGTFDPALLPFLRVEVCPWDGDACTEAPVELTSTGSGPATLRLGPGDDHYVVDWRTGDDWPPSGVVHHVTVQAGSLELGHADLDLLSLFLEAKNLGREGLSGSGSTLR